MARKLILAVFVLSLAGCGKGTAPGWSQTNPCTELSYSPLSKKFTFYSNDGRGLSADKIGFGTDANGGKMFTAENLQITERSVENRIANVEQLKIIDQITATAIRESVKAITEALAPFRGATVDTPIGGIKTGGGQPAPLERIDQPN